MADLPRIYIDSCVLMLAAGAKEDVVSQRALEEMDKEAVFLFSSIVELETLPNPTIHGFDEQVGFFKDFFEHAERVPCTEGVQALALEQAVLGVGLSAPDALHVACAITGQAMELVTSEKASQRLPKAVGIKVRTIWYEEKEEGS